MSKAQKNDNVIAPVPVVTAQKPATPTGAPESPKEPHGHRPGSQAALISREMIRRGSFTVAQVAQSLSLTPARVKSHAKHLAKRGIVQATADGFQIVKLSAENAVNVQLTANSPVIVSETK